MAKKKIKIPKYIQTKFKKPQFKKGDAVCITWLGEYKYGFIIDVNTDNEEARYKVKSYGTVYPCGIQIKEYKSNYGQVGFVQNDPGESPDTIREKATRADSGISSKSGGARVCNTNKDKVPKRNVPVSDDKVPESKRPKATTRKATSKSGATRNGTKRPRSDNWSCQRQRFWPDDQVWIRRN